MPSAHYRNLHEMAEPSGQEYKTAKYIRDHLDAIQVPYTAIGTHTIAYVRSEQKDGNWIAYRCDCDAILVDGVICHACGHDGHMAIALKLCERLKDRGNKQRHHYMVVFQASEETAQGAKILLPFLASFAIEAMIGIHILPFVELGTWYTKAETFFVGSQEVDLIFEGKGGHVGVPESCDDLILESALSLVSIQSHFARKFRSHLIGFGNIIVGGIRNVLPSRVVMEGTLRVYDETMRVQMLEAIVSYLPKQGTLHLNNATLGVHNDANLLSLFPHPYTTARTLGFADDFGEYSHVFPSLYLGYGGGRGNLHTSDFVVDTLLLSKAVDDLQLFLIDLDCNLSYNKEAIVE